MKPIKARARLERGIVLLLGVTFLVVAGLLLQSFLSLRSHQAMVDATLGDFSGFAAERMANELDQMFSALFLDQVALARSAHYDWVATPDTPRERPVADRNLPIDAIPMFFSMDAGQLVRHDTESDPEIEASVAEAIIDHLPSYPRPAPYVVLRDHRSTAIVYRKEPRYEGESVYGFVVDLAAFNPWYSRIIEDTHLLPRSLGDDEATEDLLTVGVHLAPNAEPLFTHGSGAESEPAWAFAAKAGRLAVGVQLDRDRTGVLVAGGTPGAGLPLLSGLAVLTLGLLALAVRLVHRSVRLAGLQEQFVANVSHDLKTPLAQIRMFSETLLEDRLPDPDERTRSLGIIHRQAEVLSDLVDNILHASATTRELNPVPTDVERVLDDVVDSFDPAVGERAASVDAEYRGPSQVIVDPIALTRILSNLIDNSIKHGGRGCAVAVSILNDGDTLDITVEDDGPGIPPSARRRIFDRFERIERDPGTTGAGIGLAVVRDLAVRHGGSAAATAGKRGGSRIEVSLRTG